MEVTDQCTSRASSFNDRKLAASTDRQLRPREIEHAAKSIVLRLRVGLGGLLLDGGYAWPEEGVSELDDSFDTNLDVPGGDYAATITAIDRPTDGEYRFTDVDDPEGPIAGYVIQLEKVNDFEGVPVMDTIPVLIAFESLSMRPFEPMSYFEENCGEVPVVAIQTAIEGNRLPVITGAVPCHRLCTNM